MSSEVSERLSVALAAAAPVSRLMQSAGYRLYLVGGIVRDAFGGMARLSGPASGSVMTSRPGSSARSTVDADNSDVEENGDLDCTTDASPTAVLRIVTPAASAVWTQGQRFGTIGCVVGGRSFEITTHRADSYDPDSRKPEVAFGTDVVEDLHRRDFTVNAMAVDTVDGCLIDPCGGRRDLRAGLLRTPLDPGISFGEDPLRMLRAARFIASHRLRPARNLGEAVAVMGDRLAIVSVERIRDELQKLLLLDDPVLGLRFLADTGLLSRVLPEVVGGDCTEGAPSRAVAAVTSEPDLRWAALLSGIPVSAAVARLRSLRVQTALIKAVKSLLSAAELLESPPLHAAEIRRLVHTCPVQMDCVVSFARSVAVARSECTENIDRFAEALADLRGSEDITHLNPPLTGGQVMELLCAGPGPKVGRALDFLQELVFETGPLSREAAERALLCWRDRHSDGVVDAR